MTETVSALSLGALAVASGGLALIRMPRKARPGLQGAWEDYLNGDGVEWRVALLGVLNICTLVTCLGLTLEPAQAAPATIRAQVAPLKTAVRQLKSGKWRLTLESTDSAVGRLKQGQMVQVLVK